MTKPQSIVASLVLSTLFCLNSYAQDFQGYICSTRTKVVGRSDIVMYVLDIDSCVDGKAVNQVSLTFQTKQAADEAMSICNQYTGAFQILEKTKNDISTDKAATPISYTVYTLADQNGNAIDEKGSLSSFLSEWNGYGGKIASRYRRNVLAAGAKLIEEQIENELAARR